jgi:uroporphyrinogen-III synthase
MTTSLAGLTVVNTRPAHQARPLSEAILAAGGEVIELPVIKISPPTHPEIFLSQLDRLGEFNFAIFISANAVDAGIRGLGGEQNWPEEVVIAAVGRATANRLSSQGLLASLVAPEPFNSEALLTLPEFQKLGGKKVAIFRGEGGRDVLAQTLRDRGAVVEYMECYRREIPESDPATLYQRWKEKRVLLIIITSNESLQNLVDLIDVASQPDLLSSTLVVVSQRAIIRAKELGFKIAPVLTSNASNEAIMEAIQHWYDNR